MSELLMKIREEIRLLLIDYTFIAREGAYLEGETVGIEIVPKQWAKSSVCDLHFRVIPTCISTDVPAEVVAGARKAAVEAQFDLNPNSRFAAHYLLQSLSDERINYGDLEGMSVRLIFKDAADEENSFDGITDRNGEIWFRNVFETALCSLSFEPKRPDDFSYFIETPPQSVRVSAEPSREPAWQIQPGSEPQFVYLHDQRIVALLEEIVGGNAVLTLETQAEELNGTTVRFEWGNERGEITLVPSATPGSWSGQRKLNESFAKLTSVVPAFEVMPQQKD